MKAEFIGDRKIRFTGLDPEQNHGFSELVVSLRYEGATGAFPAICLDHDVIPGIIAAVNGPESPATSS